MFFLKRILDISGGLVGKLILAVHTEEFRNCTGRHRKSR